MSGSPTVAAIVLAAGRGTRFGDEPKLLAEFDGKALVRHAVETALGADLPTMVVLGHRGADIRAALADLPVTYVSNDAYADGLSTSLKAGFAALPLGAEAAIVLLGDMPMLDRELLRQLIATWVQAGQPSAVIPVAEGRRGNPVLLSRRLAPDIATLTGDSGAGPLLRSVADVVEMPVETPGVLIDIDTPDALARLAQQPAT